MWQESKDMWNDMMDVDIGQFFCVIHMRENMPRMKYSNYQAHDWLR
jgi:hypothetical protein